MLKTNQTTITNNSASFSREFCFFLPLFKDLILIYNYSYFSNSFSSNNSTTTTNLIDVKTLKIKNNYEATVLVLFLLLACFFNLNRLDSISLVNICLFNNKNKNILIKCKCLKILNNTGHLLITR